MSGKGLGVWVSTSSPGPATTSADVRRDTTLWDLMVWAFKTECVLAAVGQDDGPHRLGTFSNSVANALELGCHIPGRTVAGTLDVHEDALTLYSLIAGKFQGPDAWLLMDAAQRGELPDWKPDLAEVRVRPVIDFSRKKPKPEVWYRDGRSRQGFFCPIVYAGFTDAEKVDELAKAKDRYAQFVQLLSVLMAATSNVGGVGFTRWSVSSLGADPTPWIGAEFKEALHVGKNLT